MRLEGELEEPARHLEMRVLWGQALADANISEKEAVLFCLKGSESADGNNAATWAPGEMIANQDIGGLSLIANEPVTRSLRRVAVWVDQHSTEIVAALLRHELEHSEQLSIHGANLSEQFHEAVHEMEAITVGLPRNGMLYQHIPMEADANAAASRYVRRRYGKTRIDELENENWPLLHSTLREPDVATVADRMLEFLSSELGELAAQFRDSAPVHSDRHEFRLD